MRAAQQLPLGLRSNPAPLRRSASARYQKVGEPLSRERSSELTIGLGSARASRPTAEPIDQNASTAASGAEIRARRTRARMDSKRCQTKRS